MITPDEVKQPAIPDQVFECFDKLIVERFDGRASHIKQIEIVNAILNIMDVTEEQIYSKRWLDVEDCYRSVGWEVLYDKPAYNEDFEAYFVFTKPRRKCS